MGAAPWYCREDSLSADILVPLLLQFLASSQMVPEPWCRGYIFLTTPAILICSPESALMCFYGRGFAISPSESGRSRTVAQFSLILSNLCLFAENARLLKREKRCWVLSKPFWSYAVLQVSMGKPLSTLKNKEKRVHKIIYLTMQLLRRFSIYYLKIPESGYCSLAFRITFKLH